MKLCITGYGESGKDTAAAWLTANTSLIFTASSSSCAAQVVFERFQANAIYPRYNNVAECFADRRNHRARWAEIIWQYNQPDGLTLYREMMATQDILVGVRKSSELAACRAAGLFDLSIWIERPGYFEAKESCEITAQDCDLSIVNGGTVEEFEAKLRRVAMAWRLL